MKKLLSSRILFVLGFIVLVATNVVVLLGVAANRDGEPESHITLTERELRLPYKIHEENSGLSLRLAWRALGKDDEYNNYPSWRNPEWLDAEKLKELGFNVENFLRSNGKEKFYKQPIPKEVFIVLENGGEPYSRALKRAEAAFLREERIFKQNPEDKDLRYKFESAERQLKRERVEETRLFAVDGGLDAGKLREQYGDLNRYIITRGLVKPRYYNKKNNKEMAGYIARLSVASVYVPLNFRQTFDSILAQNKTKKNGPVPPRYEVNLAYGKRLEPWIVSVNLKAN